MNEDTLKSMWLQLRGKIQDKWSSLTDEHLDNIAGNEEKLIEKIQELYGFSKKEARAEWNKFYKTFAKTINELEDEASTRLQYLGGSVQKFVQKSPVKALGVAALAGLLIGLRF